MFKSILKGSIKAVMPLFAITITCIAIILPMKLRLFYTRRICSLIDLIIARRGFLQKFILSEAITNLERERT